MPVFGRWKPAQPFSAYETVHPLYRSGYSLGKELPAPANQGGQVVK